MYNKLIKSKNHKTLNQAFKNDNIFDSEKILPYVAQPKPQKN